MSIQQQIRAFRMVLLLLCFGFFIAPPVDAAGITDAKADPMAQAGVQNGKALFQQNCAFCHGAGATGGAGPNLLESDLLNRPEKYGAAAALVIQGGRISRGMPAFPNLSSAQVSDIIAFLHARIAVADSEAPTGDDSLSRLLTGDATAGKQYFNGPGKCSTCHSPTGDLAGVAKKYRPMDLQTRFLYPQQNNVTATVLLPSGKKVEGKLFSLDAFYVAILDQSGEYRSWSLQKVKVQVEDPLRGHMELLSQYKDKDVHNVFAYLETLK